MGDKSERSPSAKLNFTQTTFSITQRTVELATTTTPPVDETAAYCCEQVSLEDSRNVVDRLRLAFPKVTFLAVASCACLSYGVILVRSRQSRVFKLGSSASTTSRMSDDEVKSKAFVWVFDSKGIADWFERAKFIADKLDSLLPGYYVNVFVGDSVDVGYYICGKQKGSAHFDESYGTPVLVVLT